MVSAGSDRGGRHEGDPVHSGGVEGWRGAPGPHRLGRHAAYGLADRHPDGWYPLRTSRLDAMPPPKPARPGRPGRRR